MNMRLSMLGLLVVCAALPGCQSQPKEEPTPAQKSSLSPGGVKLTLTKGQTTQAQVQEAFGTPDLVTNANGQEIWTYDKTTYEYDRRSDYATLIFIGQSGDRVRSSSKSTLLIVYFNDKDIVTDYRLSAIKY
jgi:outer membrane protein assembly factor BamE (lipoprotein component of BamABCDE complex)